MDAAEIGGQRPAGGCLGGGGGDWAGRSEEASAATNIFIFNLQVEYAEQARKYICAA